MGGHFLLQYTHTHTYKRLKGNFTDLHFLGVIFVPVFQFCIINIYNFYFFNVTFKITEMSNCYLSLKGFSFGWVTTGTSQLSLSPDPFPLDSQRSLYCLQGCLLCLQADQFNTLGPLPVAFRLEGWSKLLCMVCWSTTQSRLSDLASSMVFPLHWTPFSLLFCLGKTYLLWTTNSEVSPSGKSYPWIPSRAGYCWLCSQLCP